MGQQNPTTEKNSRCHTEKLCQYPKEITDEAVYTIVDEVELFLHQNEANRSVERIQDEVERSLMEHGFYAEAKTIYFTVGNAQKEEKLLAKSLLEPVMILYQIY